MLGFIVAIGFPFFVFAHNGVDHSMETHPTTDVEVHPEIVPPSMHMESPDTQSAASHTTSYHDLSYAALFGGAFVVGGIIQLQQKNKTKETTISA
ncbi:MAG: hypothetical protein K0S38_1057 [Candidatus Paceibacter sp.]|nr:hypothetical protein [Candidatus Paceibacter sp.]